MAKRSKKTQKSQAKLRDFVVVTFVDDSEQARDCEMLLKSNEIPVIISEQNDHDMDTKGIAIMVPEDFLDEAHVVIESRDAYDDFYDLSLENEDDEDFGSDLFEDEF